MIQKKVLFLILNFGSPSLTIDLIRDIKKMHYSNYHVLIVDNCSPDDSVEVLNQYQNEYGFDLIANSQNKGYAVGNNVGLLYSIKNNYDYTLILNSDVRISDADLLRKLIGVAESDENIACVGPKIIDIDGYETLPYVERPTLWDMTLGMGSAKKRRENYSGNYEGSVYRIYGCCMLLKNRIIEEVGLFDERTFLYYEEDILAEKFRKIGKYFYYSPISKIVHLESMAVKKAYGKVSFEKFKILENSLNIYLKYYREYNLIQILICKIFKGILFIFR